MDPQKRDRYKILLLGEGDFSFTRALCRIIFSEDDIERRLKFVNYNLGIDLFENDLNNLKITCSSFDCLKELNSKYSDTSTILKEIMKNNNEDERIEFMTGVNSCDLKASFGTEEFDLIIWNHPHLGIENKNLHKFLITHLFHSANEVLAKNGAIIITLVSGQETRWELFSGVSRTGFVLMEKILFIENEWPGYVCRRNKTGESFKNTKTKLNHNNCEMQSYMYQFVRRAEMTDVNKKRHDRRCLNSEKCTPINDNVEKTPTSIKPVSIELKKCNSPQYIKKLKAVEQVPKDLICTYCSKRLNSTRAYTQHVRAVHELLKFGPSYSSDCERYLPCVFDHCKRLFRKVSDLDDHLKAKHYGPILTINPKQQTTSDQPCQSRERTCDKSCDKSCEKSCYNSCEESCDKSCDNPDKSSEQLSEQKCHVQQTSGDCLPKNNTSNTENYNYIPCPICGQAVYNTPNGIKNHLDSLKPVPSMSIKCDICNKVFIEHRAQEQHFIFCSRKYVTLV